MIFDRENAARTEHQRRVAHVTRQQQCPERTLLGGQPVAAGQVLGRVEGLEVRSEIDGLLRGVTRDGVRVAAGAKLADVDPRNVYG